MIAECQVRYIADMVCTMIEQAIGTVEFDRLEGSWEIS